MSDDRTQTDETSPPGLTHRRNVHVRGVPEAVWRRARQNALLSGLPFKAYVIRLLAEGTTMPPGGNTDPRPEGSPGMNPNAPTHTGGASS